MNKFVCVVGGALLGMLAAACSTSYVYKLQLHQPELKCSTTVVKQKVDKRVEPTYPIGTFEHEVKRTE